MKFLILTLIVAVAQASPDTSEAQAAILRSDFEINPEGSFQYAYETENGIAGEAQGALKARGPEYPALEITGNNRYTAPSGEQVVLTYVADENGYQPQGSHLPTPPPVPEAIARSIAYNAAHAPQVQPGGFQGF